MISVAWRTACSSPLTWILPSRAEILAGTRIANAAQMLVAGAQQQHQLIGIADRNCRFDH